MSNDSNKPALGGDSVESVLGEASVGRASDSNVWTRDEVQSPCIRVCVIHPDARICAGCMRSIDEIARWSKMTPEERDRIMLELPTRSGLVFKRRGGRAARLKRQG